VSFELFAVPKVRIPTAFEVQNLVGDDGVATSR
jgi:hypothetical protein